jgi:prophage antirepressor-like protein
MELINSIDETFKFENKEIRVLGNYHEPLFVAKDICNILELSNVTESLRNIPEKWKCSEILNTLTRGKQTMIILKEPAVYQLVMRSNKQIAQKYANYNKGRVFKVRLSDSTATKHNIPLKNPPNEVTISEDVPAHKIKEI